MPNLSAFRTTVSQILDDPSNTRFSLDLVDQSLRQALADYSAGRPFVQTYNIDGDGSSRLEMPADFQPLYLLEAARHVDGGTSHPLLFQASRADSSWTIEIIGDCIGAGASLDITYASVHTIEGLDGAAFTSVPLEDVTFLQTGAAGFAALGRAFSRAENVTLQPDVTASLLKLAAACLEAFHAGVRARPGSSFAVLPGLAANSF